jgi:WD40 repeat protein
MDPFDVRLSTRFAYLQRKQREIRAQIHSNAIQIDHSIQILRTFRSVHNGHSDLIRAERDLVYDDGEILCRHSPILEPLRIPRIPYSTALQPLPTDVPQHRQNTITCTMLFSEIMPGQITVLDFARAGECVLVGGNSFVRMFSRQTGKCLIDWVATVRSSSNCVTSVVVVGHRIVFGSEDGFIRIFDGRIGTITEEFPAHGAPVTFVDVLEVVGLCLVSAADGEIRAWKKNTFELVAETSIAPDSVRMIESGLDRGAFPLRIISKSRKVLLWNTGSNTVGPGDRWAPEEYIGDGFVLEKGEKTVVVKHQKYQYDTVSLGMGGEQIGAVGCSGDLVAMSAGARFVLWRVKTGQDGQ